MNQQTPPIGAPKPAPPRRRGLSLLVWGLVGVIVLALLALPLLVVMRMIAARSEPPTGWLATDAVGLLQLDAVDTGLMLDWIGGVPDGQSIETALASQEYATAYAFVLFAPDLDDREQAMFLVRLAEAQMAEDEDRAARLFVLAGQAALTSPFIDDVARGQILLQTGDGLEQLGERTAALRDWQQVSILARFAPEISPPVREALLQHLMERYQAIGEDARVAAVQEALQVLGTRDLGVVKPVPVDTRPAPAPWPPFVLERVEARQRVAREIRFALQTGGTPAWDQLEAALMDEESAIQTWLADPDEPNPFGRQERYRRWIQQMRVLSRGVVGKGHLPQWESRRAEFDLIAAQLWNQRELEIHLALENRPPEEQALVERIWLEARLHAALIYSDPGGSRDGLHVRLADINGMVADDARLRLIVQKDDVTNMRYWRLPIGYFTGQIDAFEVFR
nr:hypothetical protein [Ardenticatena sp.]